MADLVVAVVLAEAELILRGYEDPIRMALRHLAAVPRPPDTIDEEDADEEHA